ncbi:acetylornithine transaminase [Micromonospora palythoicola]|uniref:acetylornithine transaminase n=1 Tax=Micromonospora palythoicola TaxID=3120507 RepID=UPI0038CC0B7A
MSALVSRWRQAMMDNYGTPPLALVSGSGAVVVDEAGREYVDLLGGIAVNSLGHAHPAVVAAVSKQVATLGHVSNLYVCEPPVALAELLLALAGRPGRVFFANSGAEANEAAFKLSRCTGRTQVVATVGGFHGRTMGALALTGQPAKADPFRPLPGEVTHVPYGDVAALAAAVTDATAMVILEPIQGENGVVVPPAGYLAAARRITARHGALLVLDEVQTGVGRTGHWFAHQADGVEPDVVTLAKGLGGGLPIGATLAFGPAADLLGPGSHGSTFGGNPVSCAAALAVISTIASEGLLDHVKRLGERLRRGIEALGHPLVAGVRGAGLLLGVTLTAPVSAALAGALREAGFLVNPIQPDVIRLAPPLILTTAQVDAFLAALPAALAASTGAPDRVAPVAPSGGAIPVVPVERDAPTGFSTNPVAPREASA